MAVGNIKPRQILLLLLIITMIVIYRYAPTIFESIYGILLLMLAFMLLGIGISHAALKRLRTPLHTAEKGVCGQCSYSARGLTTVHCPECGADLRRAGIVSVDFRRNKRLLYVGLLLFLWFALLSILILFLYIEQQLNSPAWQRALAA